MCQVYNHHPAEINLLLLPRGSAGASIDNNQARLKEKWESDKFNYKSPLTKDLHMYITKKNWAIGKLLQIYHYTQNYVDVGFVVLQQEFWSGNVEIFIGALSSPRLLISNYYYLKATRITLIPCRQATPSPSTIWCSPQKGGHRWTLGWL